jgi:hypothetical protein
LLPLRRTARPEIDIHRPGTQTQDDILPKKAQSPPRGCCTALARLAGFDLEDVMNHSTIMKAGAATGALFGLALLFAPNTLLAMYKAQPMNGPGIYNSMLCGGYLVAIALMNWTASKGTASEARHVIQGTFVAMMLGLAVALVRQLTDPTIPPAAWLNVLIFVVLSALYGFLEYGPKEAASPAAPTAA